MADFKQDVIDMDASLFNEFGATATRNGSDSCTIVIDENVNRFNDYGEAVFNRYEISSQDSEVELSTGDVFVMEDGRTFTITNIISSDESTTSGVATLD